MHELFEGSIYLEWDTRIMNVKENKKYAFESYFRSAFNEVNQKKYKRTVEYLKLDTNSKYNVCENCKINTKSNSLCNSCRIENEWLDVDIEKFIIPYSKTDIKNIVDPKNFEKNSEEPCIYFSFNNFKRENLAVDIKEIGRLNVYKNTAFCSNCKSKETCVIQEDAIVSLNCFASNSQNDEIIATAKIDVDDLGFLLYEVYPFTKSFNNKRRISFFNFKVIFFIKFNR